MKNDMCKSNKRKNKTLTVLSLVILYVIIFLMGIIAFVSYPVIDWVDENFGITIREVLYTVTTPLKGANTEFMSGAFDAVGTAIWQFFIIFVLLLLVELFVLPKIDTLVNLHLEKWYSTVVVRGIYYAIILVLLGISCYRAYEYLDECLKIGEYIESRKSKTTIYEDYYIHPDENLITETDKKNLIYIYMESMETTYASVEDGGIQEVNYIPNLTKMAEENVSFSNGSKLGGWRMTSGNYWTMGALFSTTAGIPFSFPIGENDMEKRSSFAKGVTSLGDVLEKQGYVQEFLCGSDGRFAGRSDYFLQHGNYEIFDYYTAIESDYISEDYFVFWGFEDYLLYQIAKDELMELAEKEKPFNLTMLTVDTHHVGGCTCKLCGNEYDNSLANVVKCADSQVYEFVEWCKKQPFYEDTVIVISGDHPRMDTILVGDLSQYERPIYNVFINVEENIIKNINTNNRNFTAMDMFPTILAALGNEIEGERLALGTNLFSSKQTLAEELGFDVLETEISKYSLFYDKNFN